jgi:hypothetical protein
MKKRLIAIVVILVVLFGSIYLFIPNYVSINHQISVSANSQGLRRNLFAENSWSTWWPGKSSDSAGHWIYKDNTYFITEKGVSAMFIAIRKKDFATLTSLTIAGERLNSTNMFWEARVPTSYNPLKRLQIYLNARKLNDDMKTILEKMKTHFSSTENIYGHDIRKELVTDSTLVSTFGNSKGYPGVEFIYRLIDDLKKYIAVQGAKETGFPMLNINTVDSINFLTRVAIPVDKILPSSGNISYKWMLPHGNILVTDVKGGPFMIDKAFHQVNNYATDYQRTAPAIPFLSLVTDRRQEPDSSKWITRIYYPVR